MQSCSFIVHIFEHLYRNNRVDPLHNNESVHSKAVKNILNDQIAASAKSPVHSSHENDASLQSRCATVGSLAKSVSCFFFFYNRT